MRCNYSSLATCLSESKPCWIDSEGIQPIMSHAPDWFCHCCTAKNAHGTPKCRVCGRLESYVQQGHHLPLHGDGALVYRPSHLSTVLPNVFEADSFDWQSLHVAAYKGNIHLVHSLIQEEADVNARTLQGHSPLFLATYSKFADCVRILLAAGASPNIATYTEKLTPLHIAAGNASFEIAQLLLDAGADLTALDNMDRNALHHTAIGGSHAIASNLIKRGIDFRSTDVHGWCARQTAEFNGHRNIEELVVRSSLTVKQAVVKELPAAEWHGELWTDFLARKNRRQTELSGRTIKNTQLRLK